MDYQAYGKPYGDYLELGSPLDWVLKLAYTKPALAFAGDMAEGDRALLQRRLEFDASADGKRIYARAVGPHEIEICAAASVEEAEAGEVPLRGISLS